MFSILIFLPSTVFSIILSKSTVQECRRTDDFEEVVCQAKLLVNFAVSSNFYDSDEVVIETLQTSTIELPLEAPVTVKLRKPEAKLHYQLRLLTVVHGKPKEEYKKTKCKCHNYRMSGMDQICPQPSKKFLNQAKWPTTRGNNAEGFCCPCRESNKLWSGTSMGRKRVCKKGMNSLDAVLENKIASKSAMVGAGLAVAKFASKKNIVMAVGKELIGRWVDQSCSIHCMTLPDDNWYAVFEILPSTTAYEIEIDVDDQTFKINPESRHEVDIDTERLTGRARLIGDYAGIRSIEQFNGVKLVAKIATLEKFDDLKMSDIDWQKAYIIPNAFFDLTGNTCNKIGVSDVAFNLQQRVCDGHIDECLDDQIDDLIANGMALPVLGKGDNQGYFCFDAAIENMKIKCKFLDAHMTRVHLSLYATDLVAIVGDPPVLLESYVVLDPKKQDGEAKSSACDPDQPCRVVLYLRNLDDTVSGAYLVGMDDCKAGSEGLQLSHGAVAVGIKPNRSERVALEFKIFENIENTERYTCDLVVSSDSEGHELLRQTIYIDAKAPEDRKFRDKGQEQLSTTEAQQFPKNQNENCQDCGFMNAICLIKNSCILRSVEDLSTAAISFGCIMLLIQFIGPIMSLLSTSVKCTASSLKPFMNKSKKKDDKQS